MSRGGGALERGLSSRQPTLIIDSAEDDPAATKLILMAPPRPLGPEQRQAVEAIAAVISSPGHSLPPAHQTALQALRNALLQLHEEELDAAEDMDSGGLASGDSFKLQLKQMSHGVEARTLTIFTLANHMSTESVLLGIDPESLFQTFAGLNNPKAKHDLDFAHKVMFSAAVAGGDGERKALHKIVMGAAGRQVLVLISIPCNH